MAVDYLGALGAGADIDSKSLVESLVAAERAPREASLNTKIEKSEAKVSAYSVVLASLKSLDVAFNKLNDADDFADYSVTAANNLTSTGSDAYQVETSSGQVSPGIYSLEVGSLATNDRRGTDTLYASSDVSLNSGRDIIVNVTDSDGTISSLNVTAPTPQRIVDTINSSALDVSASLIDTGATDGNRYKLVVQGDTGAANAFQIDIGGMLEFERQTFAAATVNSGTDTVKISSHGYTTGEAITYESGGGAPISGLTDGATYFVIRVDADVIQLAASAADAAAKIAVDMTDSGNDQQSFVQLSESTSVVLSSAVADTTPVVTRSNVSTTADSLTITGHNFATGDLITYNANGGTAIGGLTDGSEYFVVRVDANTIKLAASDTDAINGDSISFTGTGNDAQTITGNTNDALTISGHGYVSGDLIRYNSHGGTAIGGLSDGELYHVIRIDEDTIKLASSSEDAAAKINIDLTGVGNNLQTFSGPTAAGLEVSSVSASSDRVSMTSHGYSTGDRISYSANGGTAIGGLDDGGSYFVIRIDADNFQLATSITNAVAGTEIDLTGTGNSAQYFFDSKSVRFDDHLSSASDASLTFNGVAVTRATNSISDLVDGLTISLSGITASSSTISITQSTTVVKERIQELVDTYNAVNEQFSKLSDPESTEDLGGSLSGDGGFRNIRDQVKALFTSRSSTATADLRYLTEMGVSFSQTGTLEIDESVLDDNLSSRFADVVTILSADTNNQSNFGELNRGIAGDAIFRLKSLTASDGPVLTPQKTQSTKIADYQDDLADLDRRMKQIYDRYLAQFTAMEKAVDEINSTKDFLKSTLENLPFNNKNN